MRGEKTTGKIHLADWYSTFCNLASVNPTDERAAKDNLPPLDSMNMWPLISGQTMDSPREGIPISNTTLISGNYRILTGVVPLAGWTGPQFPNQTNPNGGIPTEHDCSNSGCLYNIMEDPEERTDLAPNKARCSEGYATKVGEVQSYLF